MHTARQILCAVFAVAMVAMAPLGAGQPGPAYGPEAAVSVPAPSTDGKPRVIVESCAVEGGGLVSGSVCELRVTLRNMSASRQVSSVLVSGRWPSSSPPPVDFEQTNQAFVNSIGPAQTREVVFSLKTQSVSLVALDTVTLYLDISYSFEDTMDNTNAVSLQIPVRAEWSEGFAPVDVDNLAGTKQGPGWLAMGKGFNMQLLFAGGCAVCLLIAGALVVLRIRRR